MYTHKKTKYSSTKSKARIKYYITKILQYNHSPMRYINGSVAESNFKLGQRWLLKSHNVPRNVITYSKTDLRQTHYNDVVMGAMASQITSLTIVHSTVYSGTNQRKHRSSASLAFVRGIHRWPMNSPYKWPVTRKMFPFDDVIMCCNKRGPLYMATSCRAYMESVPIHGFMLAVIFHPSLR